MSESKKGPADAAQKLVDSIKKFTNSYKALNQAGKTAFQNQIMIQMKKMDDRTKKLYEALLDATKNEYSVEKTIEFMEKADRAAKSGL